MAGKNRRKKSKSRAAAGTRPVAPASVPDRNTAGIPTFWVAGIIPVICLVGAWTFPPLATPMELKSYTSQIYLSGLLLLWYYLQRNRQWVSLTFSPARVCFGLLFLAGTLSLLWASNPHFWVYKWNKWFAGFVMFLLGLQITQNEKNLDTVVRLVVIGGVATALIGIAQYLFGFDLIPQSEFPSSTFGNKNTAAQVIVLVALLPFYFLFKDRISTGRSWLYAVSVALMFAYVYYTRTRAVWIACVFEILLLTLFIFFDKSKRNDWLHWNRTKTAALAGSAVLLVVLLNIDANGFNFFWNVASEEVSSIFELAGISPEQHGAQRYLIWGIILEMVKDNPLFGTGLGSFFDIYNTRDYSHYLMIGLQRGHNDVLELVVELGAVGFLLLTSIIVVMCILLYKLILHSEGIHRILFALLTIAVTGSMMNAQVSFPYQLPVPLVIMPFFVSLIIRGSENIEQNTFSIPLKPWFNKTATALSGLVFAFILINDLAWMRDIHVMNRIVAMKEPSRPWKPVNPIFSQGYITGGRSIIETLQAADRPRLSLYIAEPLLEYWPDTTTDAMLVARSHLNLKQYEEAEYWIKKAIASQPEGEYTGDIYLAELYLERNQTDDLRELYNTMKEEPEELLRSRDINYRFLHTASINVNDYEMTIYFYDKYMEHFSKHHRYIPGVIANHAVFYLNNGRTAEAVPYIKRALELNPNLPLSNTFNEILAQFPGQ